MIRFKEESLLKLLKENEEKLNPAACQNIKKLMEKGANGIAPSVLTNLCRDLKCLPTDIVQYV
jgi:DNA-binding Xre family transcriptional regulator